MSSLENDLVYRKYGKHKVRTGTKGHILRLCPGSILFFRQNIIHGGYGNIYRKLSLKKYFIIIFLSNTIEKGNHEPNIRFFMYIDIMGISRRNNATQPSMSLKPPGSNNKRFK